MAQHASGSIFPENHPYYKKNRINKLKIKEKTEGYWNAERIGTNKKIYNDYAGDSDYTQEHFDESTGGFILRHKNAEYNDLSRQPLSEQKVIAHLVKHGSRVIIPELVHGKNFDITVDNSNWDIKAVTGNIKGRTEERVKLGLLQADNIILHFTALSPDEINELARGLGNVKNEPRLNSVLIISNDKQAVISKIEMLRGDYSALDDLKK